uniref:Adrenomedullin 2 n=1 Tax=Tetraodon nigroviridis TaxID=99883 RepID=H3C0N1_TETNG
MQPLLPAGLLLSLLALEVQAQAVTQRNLGLPHRFSLLRTLRVPKSSFMVVRPTLQASDTPVVIYDHVAKGDHPTVQRAWPRGEAPLRSPDPPLGHGDRVSQDRRAWKRRSRGRRHANGGGGRNHVMRVACVLGTCQVQNLSHRLYLLIGQNGKEDSSPINPHSPHSYG